MPVISSPIRSPIRSPIYSPTVGAWGGTVVPLDDQIIAMMTSGADRYYRISDLSTLFQETTGAAATTPATIDGFVGTIKDKGPNGGHLVAVGTLGILRSSAGVYWIEKTDATTYYSEPNAGPSVAWLHYLACASRRKSAVDFSFMWRASNTFYSRLALAATNNTGLIQGRNSGGGPSSVTAATNAAPVDTWTVVDGISNPLQGRIGVNGAAFVSGATLCTEVSAAGFLNVFRTSAGGADTSTADFAGGLYLNHEPTTDQRATINLALQGMFNPAVLTDLGLLFD